jgi:Zn finger protein HypA/HybF involved in hydrogenase expression
MTHAIIKCSIEAGKFAANPIRQMVRRGEQLGAIATDPLEFRCSDCRLRWEADTFTDVRTVVCSNCYSDKVRMTAIRIEVRDDWKLEDWRRPRK